MFAGRMVDGAMSQNPIDRSRLASARMVGSGTTIPLLALILAPQIKALDNLARTFLITAAIFLVMGTILFMITFLTARETVIRDVAQVSLKQSLQTVRQNGPLVRLCLSSFFYLTGQTLFFVTGNLLFALVGSFFAGVVGMALLNVMTRALEADTVEYGEYWTGIRTEGATYAAFSFTRKFGQAVGAGIAGYGLAWAGYDGAVKGTGRSQAKEHQRPSQAAHRDPAEGPLLRAPGRVLAHRGPARTANRSQCAVGTRVPGQWGRRRQTPTGVSCGARLIPAAAYTSASSRVSCSSSRSAIASSWARCSRSVARASA
jgi:Na+/melibiose symporter-like transporter